MHRLRITKSHFRFCRVYVDIDCARIERQFEHEAGRGTAMHLVAHCISNSVQDDFVTHPATINKQVLSIAIGDRAVGFEYEPFDCQQARVNANGYASGKPFRSEHSSHACRPRLHRPALNCAPVMRELQRNLWPHQTDATNGIKTMCVLGSLRFQEATAGGCVEKQFRHRDRRSVSRARGLGQSNLATFNLQAKCIRRTRRATGQRKARNRCD